MRSSLTTPATPSRYVLLPVPLREAPMASISSMKPMAPPSRRAVEKDGMPGGATHTLPEGLVAKKEVEGLDDLFDDHREALHVIQRDVDVGRTEGDVGRAAGAEE